MKRFWSILKDIFFAAKVIATAIVAPVATVFKLTIANKPVHAGRLAFAIWRLFVWLFFGVCVTTSVGVPPVIAMLFLIDLAIVGVQIVAVAAIAMKEQNNAAIS